MCRVKSVCFVVRILDVHHLNYTDIMFVNIHDCLGSESFVMPVKHWSCLQFLIVVFTVILLLFVHCVLLIYTQLYEFMLVVKNCLLFPTRINGLGLGGPNSRWQFKSASPWFSI